MGLRRKVSMNKNALGRLPHSKFWLDQRSP
jgi:hypothetical protein